ncbi:MAG: HAD-IIA family hydrolase [Candidatus Nanohalobium sp.]
MDLELALIDMDGTVYHGERMIEGAETAVEYLRENGVEVFFMTNYAGRKREKYSEMLNEMGIEASRDEIMTSGWLTAEYIVQNFPGAEVFVLGESDLKEELREQGVKVQETCESPDVVVASNKEDFSYDDLTEIIQGVSRDVKLIGTNPDETYVHEEGELPAAGPIIAAVENMLGKKAEVIGKPSEDVIEVVSKMKNQDAEDFLVVGDRLNTDILLGNENDAETALVLTGVTDQEDLENSDIKPDHVLNSIADLDEVF